jgi:hypothetical protein
MIRYTVLWREQAEAELAVLWSHSSRRHEITEATNHLDSALQKDAHRRGIVHPHDMRAISHACVTLYFRVDEADRKVFVEAVRLTESN